MNFGLESNNLNGFPSFNGFPPFNGFPGSNGVLNPMKLTNNNNKPPC